MKSGVVLEKRFNLRRSVVLAGGGFALLAAGLAAVSCGPGQPTRELPERALGTVGNGWPDLKQPFPVDCGVVPPNLEFLPVEDFEKGWAVKWYNYGDQSSPTYLPNGFVPATPNKKGLYNLWPLNQDVEGIPTALVWGLRASELKDGGRCGSRFALNMRGGQFLRYGGGFGHRLNGDGTECPKGACPNPQDADLPPLRNVPPEKLQSFKEAIKGFYRKAWNVSEWDGIAFWARRGPEGQVGLRIAVTDRFNSEGVALDLLKMEQEENAKQKKAGLPEEIGISRNCEPVRVCYSQCLNGKPCSSDNPANPEKATQWHCFDPATDPPAAGNESQYQSCGPKACLHPSDPGPFDDYACRPFTFANEENEYCVPKDPPNARPPEAMQRCADIYLYTVNLTQEWQFYKVPFSELRQEGRLKQTPYLDKASIDYLFLGFAAGWLDTWVDDLAFYREKK